MRALRLFLLGMLLAPFATAASPPLRLAFAPPTGTLLLTLLTPIASVCLGDRVAIDVLVADAVYGAPPGGVSVVLSSSLGGADSTWTPGGVARLHYQPRLEGSETILFTATAPNSATGLASLPVQVDRCRWTWDLFYTGTYPHPEGFWRFSEQATVAAGTLETAAGTTLVEGSGTIAYALSAHGEVTEASCDFSELTGTTGVKVTGVVGQPAGSMALEFAFDSAPIRGVASFTCRFGPDRVSFDIPVNEVSAALSSLPLQPLVVRTDFGLISRSVSTAIFWLVPGSGRLTLVVTPESSN